MTDPSITPFIFEKQQLRILIKNGNPWFITQDICDALNITNSRDAISKLDEDEKGVALTDTLGGKQKVNIINESGMYTLILRCRDAVRNGSIAHRFRKWITNEVLPSIRKTGSYQISRRAASINTFVTCTCCRKPADIITIHKIHRERTEIVAVCRDRYCQKEPFKCDLTFSYYIELSKVKNNNDAEWVIDKLSYKKRLTLVGLLSN